MNHISTYRHPLFLITDDDYAARGAIVISEDGRFIATDTAGRHLFSRKDFYGAIEACKKHGRMVTSSYYGIPDGLPTESTGSPAL